MNLNETLFTALSDHQLWDDKITLKRNEFLTLGGTIDTRLYFIESGSFKISIMEEDKEHIIRFGYQNDFIAALDSFITNGASQFYIQALKKSELLYTTKEKFFSFINNHPDHSTLWKNIIENVVIQQMEREHDILITSPKRRYERVLKRSPHLFQEIPHKYIAAYLRMTPETLSRLKKS